MLGHQDPAQHVLAEGQVEVPRQHAQAGHRFIDRPLAAGLGEAAVVAEAAIPILERIGLPLHRHDRAGALHPFRLQHLGIQGQIPARHPHRRRQAIGRPARRLGHQPAGQLAAHKQLHRADYLGARFQALEVCRAHQPGPAAGLEAVATWGEQQHLLVAEVLLQLVGGPVPQGLAGRQVGPGAGGQRGVELLQAGGGQRRAGLGQLI